MKKIFAVALALLSVLSLGLLVQPTYGKYAAEIHVGSFEVSFAASVKPNLVGGETLNRYIKEYQRYFGVTEVVFDFYKNHPFISLMREILGGRDVGEYQEGAEEKDKVWMQYWLGTVYVLSESEICAASCEGMFKGCSFLSSVTFGNFNTSGTESMKEMFSGCRNLQELNLTGFDTSNVSDMEGMFFGCGNLRSIVVSEKWSTKSVKFGDKMFENCSNLRGGNGTGYSPQETSYFYARIDEADAKGYLTRG